MSAELGASAQASEVAAMVASFAYLISPVDAVPEAALGPLGMVDDAGVITIVAFYVFHLIKARRTNMPIRQAAGIAFRETARGEMKRRRQISPAKPDRDVRQ